MKRSFSTPASAAHLLSASKSVSTAVLVSLSLFMPALAFASSTAHHDPSLADLKHPWINFFTYAVLLYFLAAKPLKAAWIARADGIRQSVESAQDELRRAEKLLNGIEESTRHTKERQQEVYKELIGQGEAEAAAIIVEAKNKAERIAHQARELIAGESRAAEVALRKDMISRAENIARARFASGGMSHRNATYTDAALKSANRLLN